MQLVIEFVTLTLPCYSDTSLLLHKGLHFYGPILDRSTGAFSGILEVWVSIPASGTSIVGFAPPHSSHPAIMGSRDLAAIKMYDGTTEVDDWIKHVKRAAFFMGWADDKAVMGATLRLDGDASRWFDSLSEETRDGISTLDDLRDALGERFKPTSHHTLWAEFNSFFCYEGESIHQYADRYRRLCNRLQVNDTQPLAINQFIPGKAFHSRYSAKYSGASHPPSKTPLMLHCMKRTSTPTSRHTNRQGRIAQPPRTRAQILLGQHLNRTGKGHLPVIAKRLFVVRPASSTSAT